MLEFTRSFKEARGAATGLPMQRLREAIKHSNCPAIQWLLGCKNDELVELIVIGYKANNLNHVFLVEDVLPGWGLKIKI